MPLPSVYRNWEWASSTLGHGYQESKYVTLYGSWVINHGVLLPDPNGILSAKHVVISNTSQLYVFRSPDTKTSMIQVLPGGANGFASIVPLADTGITSEVCEYFIVPKGVVTE